MTNHYGALRDLAEEAVKLVGEDPKRVLGINIEACGRVSVERLVLDERGKPIPVGAGSLERQSETVEVWPTQWPIIPEESP